MANRNARISEEIKRELGNIIQNELKDPRLPPMVSVLSVEVSNDYRHAKVYVTVMGGEGEKARALEALNSAAGFIRREIGHRIRMRNTPEFHFTVDESIEHGIYISKLLDNTLKKTDRREEGQGDS